MNFGMRLKELRLEYNLKQDELAEPLGLKRPAISKYETATIQPDFDRLCQIADYFNVSIDYLLGRTDSRRFDAMKQIESNLNPEDQRILYLYHSLTPHNRDLLVERAETMVQLQEEDTAIKKGAC